MENKIGQARIAPSYNCNFCYDTGVHSGTAELDGQAIVIQKPCTNCDRNYREYVTEVCIQDNDFYKTIYSERNFDKLFARMIDISIALEGISEIIGEDCQRWKLQRKDKASMLELSNLIKTALNSYIKRDEFLDEEERGESESE